MGRDGTQKRRYWPWIAVGLIFIPPLVVILSLTVIFKLRAITDHQRQPPPELTAWLEDQPGYQSSPPGKENASVTTESSLLEVLELYSAPTAVAIYEKWQQRLSIPNKIFQQMKNTGEALTPEVDAWLRENTELIDDLLALAAEGGVRGPHPSELMALWRQGNAGPHEMAAWPRPNFLFFQYAGRALAAESRRRREGGDEPGAAEALLAIQQIGYSIREPLLISHFIGLAVQSLGQRELALWLAQDPPPPEIARRLREEMGNHEITLAAAQPVLALACYHERASLVQWLDTPSRHLMIQFAGHYLQKPRSFDFWIAWDMAWEDPGQLIDGLGVGLARTVAVKSTASEFMKQFDKWQASSLKALATGRLNHFPSFADFDAINSSYGPSYLSDFKIVASRTLVNQAERQLNLAALDRIISDAGAPAPQPPPDPFDGAPLRVVEQPGRAIIYSIGPDGKDQRGSISYDPTNGTLSSGDIIVNLMTR